MARSALTIVAAQAAALATLQAAGADGLVDNVNGMTLDKDGKVVRFQAMLVNAQGAVVYDWTIQAPQTSLPPREMVEFNSAEIDIPRNAEELNLQFVPFEGG